MSEERKKEFFEYGQKISRKLGIPEKVEKTNAFYARHPKAMSFAIFGFCCLLLLLSEVCLRGSGMSVHRPVGELHEQIIFQNVNRIVLREDKGIEQKKFFVL